MGLLAELKSKDKTKLFSSDDNFVTYSTGILPLDYANGFWQEVVDDKGNSKMVPMLGIRGGSFTGIMGNTGTGKTTMADQMAFNIIKDFEDSLLIHIDAERTALKQRLIRITGTTMDDERIILKNQNTSIEDVLAMFNNICDVKESGGENYKYEIRNMSYDGKPFKVYIPTVIIIDSLPSFNSNSTEIDDLGTNMDPARGAKDLKRFYNNCLDRMLKYNINIFTVNHIAENVETNKFKVSPKGLLMLSPSEVLPKGKATQFYSQNYFRTSMIKSNMYDKTEVGFEGFKATIQVAKTKTNFIGSTINVAFNKDIGFDPIFSLYEYADSIGIVLGRNPNLYFEGLDTMKFSRKLFRSKFISEADFRNAILRTLKPYLLALLGTKDLSESERVRYGDLIDEDDNIEIVEHKSVKKK